MFTLAIAGWYLGVQVHSRRRGQGARRPLLRRQRRVALVMISDHIDHDDRDLEFESFVILRFLDT